MSLTWPATLLYPPNAVRDYLYDGAYPAPARPFAHDLLATMCTYRRRGGLEITWFGFRDSRANAKLPHYYACELPPGRDISLYEIGGIGAHDVDVHLTDVPAPNVVPAPMMQLLEIRGTTVTPNGRGLFEAPRVMWDPRVGCPGDVTAAMSKTGAPCILWAISYKHGSRYRKPWDCPVRPNPGGPFQDDDGGPASGYPGGEEP